MDVLSIIKLIEAGTTLAQGLSAVVQSAKNDFDLSDQAELDAALEKLEKANTALFVDTRAKLALAARKK